MGAIIGIGRICHGLRNDCAAQATSRRCFAACIRVVCGMTSQQIMLELIMQAFC